MRKVTGFVVILSVFSFLILAFINPQEKVWNEEEEKKAIMALIESETNAFYKRDYKAWATHFVQTEYAFQAWNNGDGSIDAKTGWPQVDGAIGKYIKDNPVEPGSSSHPKVERKNMVVKFFTAGTAFLIWDQYNSDKKIDKYTFSKETRIVEKQNGNWKIVSVAAFWDYKNLVNASSIK